MPRRSVTAALAGLVLVTSGCQLGSRTAGVSQPTPPLAGPGTQAATPAAVASPPAAGLTPAPTASPTPRPPTYDVKAAQRELTALAYYAGPVDGVPGAAFAAAVTAFQKVNGLSADGTVGAVTLGALKKPRKPVLRGTGQGTRIEVDLTRQVLYLVRDGVVARIMPVSSGNGMHYVTTGGGQATALSPVGYYKVERRMVGERHAPLGTLYDPQFFYRGWAIHGSNSVPPYPASHGCIRLTRADATYLYQAIRVGTEVYLYGGSHTFVAGSSAPGTTDPGGDTTTGPTPGPSPAASPTPSPRTSPRPSPSTSPSASPSPLPTVVPTP